MFTREQIITRGRELKLPTQRINKALDKFGYDSIPTVGGLGKNFLQDARDMGRGFRTATGLVVRPVANLTDNVYQGVAHRDMDRVKKAFSDTLNNQPLRRATSGALIGGSVGSIVPGIGTLGGAATGALMGLMGPKNLANSILSTYNTNLDEVTHLKTSPKGVVRGMYDHPLFAASDILSLGGAKALTKAGKAMGKSIPDNAPMALQAILPSQKLKDFNRSVTDVVSESNVRRAGLYSPYNELDSMPKANRTEIVKNITTNEGVLNEVDKGLASRIKQSLIANEEEAIARGLLDKDIARVNTVAQYAVAKLGKKYPSMLFDDVVGVITNGPVRVDRVTPEMVADINKVIEQGGKLYDEKKITFLTQAKASTRDPLGQVIASDIAKQGHGYFGTNRIIGRTTPEDLGKVLEQSIFHQLEQVNKAENANDIVRELVKGPRGVGEKVAMDIKELPKGKVLINPEVFNKKLNKSISKDGELDIRRALRSSQGLAEGSYMIDKIYMKALDNMFAPSRLSKTKKFTTAFKKAVLANPHWFMLNRIGNFSNNQMGGVTLLDYKDAFKHAKLVPDRLYQQTSFNSYVNAGAEGSRPMGIKYSFMQPVNRLRKAGGKFMDSDKSIGDIGELLGNAYTSISDITANPGFRLESMAERIDRYANFIHQAKKLAKETGKDWKEIVKKADKDNSLYNKLNKEVNLDLGDYLGRNYAVPNEVYDVLSEAVPFYRFLSQTGRTTAHQLANHGLAYNANVMIPSRAGYDLTHYIPDRLGIEDSTYEGGVPYRIDADGIVHTMGIEPLPIQAVLEDVYGIGSGTNISSIASPLLTMGSDILNYKKNGKFTPSSPELNALKMVDPDAAKYYQPSLGEILKYGGNQILGTTMNPWRIGTTYLPEAAALLFGHGLQSRYDTNPFKQNPLSYKREGPTELIGRWLPVPIQTRSNLKKYKPTPKTMMRNKAKAARNRRKAEAMKGDKR